MYTGGVNNRHLDVHNPCKSSCIFFLTGMHPAPTLESSRTTYFDSLTEHPHEPEASASPVQDRSPLQTKLRSPKGRQVSVRGSKRQAHRNLKPLYGVRRQGDEDQEYRPARVMDDRSVDIRNNLMLDATTVAASLETGIHSKDADPCFALYHFVIPA